MKAACSAALRLFVFSLYFALSLPGWAATDTQTGTAGTIGAQGASGDPGDPGGDGTAGGNATANATSGDATNTATATGGAGGRGGSGGGGSPSGADGGDGGNGANGGDGDATASTTVNSGNATATATANGGNGGNGGAGGFASGGGTPGDGGDAGDGGAATISSTATNNGSGSATANGTANGGDGGGATGSGDAGSGASVTLVDDVDASGSGAVTLNQTATGGNSGSVQDGLSGTAGSASSSLTKTSTTSSDLNVNAAATGGNGGTRASSSGKAADGGDATAFSSGTNSAGDLDVSIGNTWDARGGTGGSGFNGADGGDGGDATNTSIAETSGDGNAIRTFGDALGGNGGSVNTGNNSQAGAGGSATSTNTATATGDSAVTISTNNNTGGTGGSVNSGTGSGGAGGDVTVTSNGSNAGAAGVSITAIGNAGAGGGGRGVGQTGGAGGVSSVTASGSSSGGGAVTVTVIQTGGAGGAGNDGANAGAGASSALNNAVSGATAGNLTLNQTATAGAGGTATGGGTAGAAGAATSTMTNVNTIGGNVTGTSTATGGTGGTGSSGSSGSDGGSGTASISLTDSGTVSATATANGGNGGTGNGSNAGDGGAASLGTVFGQSTGGGNVTVTGTANGANGGAGNGAGDAGDGATVSLTDIVDGTSSGAVTLNQNATGGNSGSVQDGLNGAAGSASSSLTRSSTTSSDLTVNTSAFGGSGGTRNSASGKAADGGDATSFTSGTNSAGDLDLDVANTWDARGGNGGAGFSGADGGDGGDATNTSIAETSGDGNAVRSFGDALGGTGGSVSSGNNSQAGAGGSATSTNTVTATGNSAVTVSTNNNTGGTGGSVNSGTGDGGAGGAATVSGSGSNAGTAFVSVTVIANGGGGGGGRGVGQSGGVGGVATVSASGTSSGGAAVTVTANQTSGAGGAGNEGADGGAGASSTINNVVSGATSGNLTLTQTATGGRGGSAAGGGISGVGGAASANLTNVNTIGGNVTGTTTANAGAGGTGSTGSVGSDGAAAAASISLTDTGTVSATATASGGNGGSGTNADAGDGGAASLGTVFGESTGGGNVTVSGTANGANGGAASGAGDAGDGASVAVTDVVDGTSSGNFALNQTVTGGNSGTVQDGLSGTAGTASSSLTRSSTTSSNFDMSAGATGGNGGSRTSSSGQAADGGAATSFTSGTNSAGTLDVDISNTWDARGGNGGLGSGGADGGAGGNATNTTIAETSGDGNNVRTFGDALGGTGGGITNGDDSQAGAGGNAISTNTATATGNSAVTVSTNNNTGGAGGNVNSGTGDGGAGGSATVSGDGSNAGNAAVSVFVVANGGRGGTGRGVGNSGGAGGVGSVSASGASTDGSVTVNATQTSGAGGTGNEGADGGAGASSTINNAVSGATAGNLSLTQAATGGAGGSAAGGGVAGVAGAASSTLTNVNTIGGNVTGTSTANAGAGGTGSSGSDGGDGATGTASISLTDSGTVSATATANGGNGGSGTETNGGDGGGAALGTVFGESTGGGNVTVSGTANGANGGFATVGGNAGSGASVSVTDIVDGTSSGNVTLNQTVTGGNSGGVQDGLNGAAGSAFSSLTRSSTTSSDLTVNTAATGGNGGTRTSASGKAADGGDGTSFTSATNSAGDLDVDVATTWDARGGTGGTGSGGADSGDGGDATNTSIASTSGDGNATRSFGDALGGNGGGITSGDNSQAGAGGTAISTNTVTAAGNSAVTISSNNNTGGSGGNVNSGTGSGGDGGNATSTGTASTAGTSLVSVTVTTQGGTGGTARGSGNTSGDGGDAFSVASGTGGGNTTVTAAANGGNAGAAFTGSTSGLSGNGTANAMGIGTSGSVRANATTGTTTDYLVNDVIVTTFVPTDGTVNATGVAKLSGAGFDVSAASGQQAAALAYGAPDDSVTLPNLLGNAVLANFDVSATTAGHTIDNSGQLNTDMFGMAVLGGAKASDGSTTSRTTSSVIDFDVDTSQLLTGDQNLLVGFMNPVVTGNAWDDPDFSVRFRVQIENATVVDQTFTDQASALAYFDSQTIDLGTTSSGVTGDLDLDFILDVTSDDAGSGFAVDLVTGNSTITERAVPYVPAAASTVEFGDRHVGDATLQGIEVQNVAASGSDGADASFAAADAGVINNGGSIDSLAAGASDSTSMQVGIDTATSGIKSGTTTIQLDTDGTVSGTAESFGQAFVTVGGTVYDFADPTINNDPIAFGNVHVGDATSAQAVSITNSAPNDGFSENLDASANGTTGGVTASGSFNDLAAQGTDNSSITVNIDTSTAGNKNGVATIDFVSDGDGINSLGQTTLASQDVTVTGGVYRFAEATIDNPLAFNFGNVQVGNSVSQAVSISNTAVADAFSEGLNASFGAATDPLITNNAGTIGLLAAGGTDNTSMVIGVNTSAAGAVNGTQAFIFQSDGSGTSELGTTDLAGQNVTVMATIQGGVFRLANPVIENTQPVAFGNVREGDVVASQAISILNDVPADGFSEALDAQANGNTGGVTNNGGTFALVGPSERDDTSITVAIDTSSAGDKSGAATIDFQSNGEGSSGLGITDLASQDVQVTGAVYRLAEAGAHTPEPVVLGDSHVGDTAEQALSMTNTATADGFSESLNSSIGSATGDANTNGGSFNLLGAGATDNSSLVVGIDTSSAGAKSGTAIISSESDGTGTSDIAGNVATADQTVNVSGNVYRLAEASAATPNPVTLADSHVGDTAQQALTIGNTATADAFSENLNASIGGNTGDATSSGSITGLAAGGSDNSSLVVGIDTSSAGAKSGSATISLESDGDGINSLGQTALASQTVDVSGNVYRLAEASAATPNPVVLANVHVGDTSQQALTIGNTATADAFSENLNASIGGNTGDASSSGSITGLAAGGSDNSSLVVGIDTSTAGAKSGSATISLESDGDGINSLGQTALASQTVNVSGNVYRLAEATINNAANFNFGAVQVGDSVSRALSVSNTATSDAFSEALNASFGAADDARITNNAGAIGLLAAGGTDAASMFIGIDTSSAGMVTGTQTINFASDGTGTSELGITGLGSQGVPVSATISAAVFRLANPVIENTQPVAFGNVREGDVVASQAISILNDVPADGFSEALDAQANGNTGGVTNNGGTFALVGPSERDDTSITVAIDTSSAGDKSGAATIDFQSNGEGSSGLGITDLASQDVQVTGAVYRLAEAGAHTPEPVVLGDSHVGDTAEQALSMTNTATADGFSESLNSSIGSATGDANTNGGSFNLLGAGATDNSSLVVGIDTSSAGAKSGTAIISSESDGTGTSDISGNVALADQTVNVSGSVYRLAEASAASPNPVTLANVHVGDTSQQALTIGNTATADAFSENLNASIGGNTGDATSSGAISGLAAGGSDNSSLIVGIDTSSAGAKSGAATISLESDGDGINSLGQTALASQTVNVSGNVYRLAEATIDNPLAFSFGNVQVGNSVSQAVSISNTATADGFSEGLTASFGTATDPLITNNAGTIGLLAAGGTDNTSMSIGVDTSAAGAVNGTQAFVFASDGSGTSELGVTGLAGQSVTVTATISGGVFRLANPVIENVQPVAFGNVREGAAVGSQAISILNDVPADGFSEALDAQANGNTGGVTNNGGTFALLGPSATDNTSITVSIDTNTAGDKSGAATIDFQSNGEGSSSLGITQLASQDVQVTGAVYRLASIDVVEPVVINARVGDVAEQAVATSNTATADGYSESLNASIGGAAGDATSNGGSFNLLAAGDTDSSSLVVGLDTSTSGAKSGTAIISSESDGTGTSNIEPNIALADATVNISGNVWQAAEADVQPGALDFGIVHVGDSVGTQNISVANVASGELVDVIQGDFGSVTGPFNGSGDLGAGVSAGDIDNTSLNVGLNTAAAGIFTGSAALDLVSHNPDLVDLDIATDAVGLTAQVNNYANPVFDFVSGDGSFSGGGENYLLDFGTIDLTSTSLVSSTLEVGNDIPDPGDLLDGLFDLGGASVFGLTNFGDFFDLNPGDFISDLGVSLNVAGLGIGDYMGSIILNPFGHNASGFRAGLAPITLAFRAIVTEGGGVRLSEPSVFWLTLFGMIAMLIFVRYSRTRSRIAR